MTPLNFSKDLLEGLDLYSRKQLSVVPMEEVVWSDWGSEDHIVSVLRSLGYLDRLFKGHSLDDDCYQLPAVADIGMPVSL
jgi:hypothetical protein